MCAIEGGEEENMKIKKILISVFLLGSLVVQITVFADGSLEEKSTPIEVKIKPKELYLTKIAPLNFGKHKQETEAFVLRPKEDFTVQVVDKRDSKGDWSLYYQFALFKNEKKQVLPTRLILGVGTLTIKDQSNKKDIYRSYKADSNSQQSKALLVKTKSSGLNMQYEYRIRKKNIRLNVPKNTPAGRYKAEQKLLLVEEPKIE